MTDTTVGMLFAGTQLLEVQLRQGKPVQHVKVLNELGAVLRKKTCLGILTRAYAWYHGWGASRAPAKKRILLDLYDYKEKYFLPEYLLRMHDEIVVELVN